MRRPKGLYAIIDNKADDIQGQIVAFNHPAAATRFFNDVASHPESAVAAHPEDYDLWQLGFLNEQHELVPAKELVISGQAWLSLRQDKPQLVKEG